MNYSIMNYDSSVDVFSFAMIMYIMITRNTMPYGQLPPSYIISEVQKGARPVIPPKLLESSHPSIQRYIAILNSCWVTNCFARPSFVQLSAQFKSLLKLHKSEAAIIIPKLE